MSNSLFVDCDWIAPKTNNNKKKRGGGEKNKQKKNFISRLETWRLLSSYLKEFFFFPLKFFQLLFQVIIKNKSKQTKARPCLSEHRRDFAWRGEKTPCSPSTSNALPPGAGGGRGGIFFLFCFLFFTKCNRFYCYEILLLYSRSVLFWGQCAQLNFC